MSVPISLIQMPNDVMEHILEYLDFTSILALRKVCHDLRNFIDDTKPASLLTKIRLFVTRDSINSVLDFSWSHPSTYIDYLKNREGCLVKCRKGEIVMETIVKNENFVTVFCKDFDIILRHQKTVLEEVSCTRLNSKFKKSTMKSVSKCFKSMNKPLQVETLYMAVNNQDDILAVLPYIDPKPLELIEISGRAGGGNAVINLDEIGQLEQWKQANELEIARFRLSGLFQNFEHFSKIDFWYQPFSTAEIILLKEMFFCSSILNTMVFNYNNHSVMIQKLIEAFGEHFLDSYKGFFRIPHNSQLLEITKQLYSFNFNRIEQSDVPQNAIILN